MNATNDPPGIHWKEATSRNGKKFEIGYPYTPGEPDPTDPPDPPRRPGFSIEVNWPVASGGWKDTSDKVEKTSAISRYDLHRNGGSTWSYRLDFTCNSTFDYYFQDNTGDQYRVNTFRTGDHYVRYNSDKPTIHNVSGD